MEPAPSPPNDAPLLHGEVLQIGGVELQVRTRPAHTGSVCLYAPALATVLTGDPAAHGVRGLDAHADPAALRASIGEHLFTLPPETTVRPGHGETTSIAARAAPPG